MDRTRFEYLLDAYGADFRRWPERERASGEAFARANSSALALQLSSAKGLDHALDLAKTTASPSDALMERILAAAPREAVKVARWKAMPAVGWALAACALLGVLIGYGGAMLAPAGDQDAYFAAAFEAPSLAADPGDEG